MSVWPIFIVIALVTVALIAAVTYQERKRRQALSLLAGKLGLEFDPDPGDIHDKYEGFSPFGQGHSRTSWNLLEGRSGEFFWQIFDYRYTTGSGKRKQTHHCSVVAAAVQIVFPRFEMRAEGFFDRLAEFVGFDDIDFESERFSRRYCVKSADRKFAYDLIHPQMIEWLLTIQPRHWQLAGNKIVLIDRGRISPEQIEPAMSLIQRFVSLVPAYVRQDRGLSA